jgi:hypothetical protein
MASSVTLHHPVYRRAIECIDLRRLVARTER